MSYPLNERELIINLKTGYDVEKVFIHYGDPFEAGILGGKETWTGNGRKFSIKEASFPDMVDHHIGSRL